MWRRLPAVPISVLVVASGLFQYIAGAGLPEITDTLALVCQGSRVGTLIHQMHTDPASGISAERTLLATRNWMNTTDKTDSLFINEERTFFADGSLSNAAQSLRNVSGVSTWSMQAEKGEWGLTVNTGGISQTRKIPKPADSNRSMHAVYRTIASRELRVGDTWKDTAFDMVSGENIVTLTTCKSIQDSQGLPQYEFTILDNVSRREQRWIVDTTGHTLLQEIPPVFVARKTLETPDADRNDLQSVFTIKVSRAFRTDAPIALELDSADLLDELIRIFYTRQERSWILAPTLKNCSAQAFFPVEDSLKKFLGSTVTMQANNSEIRELAAKVVGGKRSACDAIAALTRQVYSSLEKRNTATYSSAVETLHSGFGDCGEHAVLLGALLRAAGIPCRLVLGLVYVEAKNEFAYHAWVALPNRNGWIFSDPAFGDFPAQNTLVPLLFDDDGRNSVHLAGLIGRIKISSIAIGQ